MEPVTSCPLRRSGFPCILAGGSRAWVALSLPDPLSQVAGSCLTAVCLPQQRKFTIKKGQKAKSTWAVGLSPSFPSHVARDISSLKQKKVANFIFEFRAAWDRRWKIYNQNDIQDSGVETSPAASSKCRFLQSPGGSLLLPLSWRGPRTLKPQGSPGLLMRAAAYEREALLPSSSVRDGVGSQRGYPPRTEWCQFHLKEQPRTLTPPGHPEAELGPSASKPILAGPILS